MDERVLAERNQAMPLVDIEAVRNELMQISWVQDARVSRQLPDTLVVDIVEREPHAVLRKGDRMVLIDSTGHELEPVTAQQAKGKLPVIPLDERVEVIRHLAMVDDVVVDFSPRKIEVWERVRFDVLFKGDDWRGTPKGDKLEADMASVGVRVLYFPYTVHTSSTLLRSLLTQH